MSEQQTNQQANQPLFVIEKIYIKDLSVEIPNAPKIFLENTTPQIDIQLHTQGTAVDAAEGIYEVVLTITATAKAAERTVFLVEAAQAGIFMIRNVPQSDMGYIMEATCPNILFPFARQTVCDTVVRAGFPPVLLNPMNFEAMYQQRQQQGTAGQTTH